MIPIKTIRINLLPLLILLTVLGCSTSSNTDKMQAQLQKNKQSEVTPSDLKGGIDTPITPEREHITAVSRPSITNVEEKGISGLGKKYFDVVDEQKNASLTPSIDKAALPIRTITLSDNSQSKDFKMRYGVVWERLMGAMLQLPLVSVDRSSGIIITDWKVDLDSQNSNQIRYKYTIRVMDKGVGTRIRVIPFLEIMKNYNWQSGRPNLIVTKRMFYRIEQELKIPVPSIR
ncbi:MAG TPA: DUF3576 domain-containing protein [Nitrospinota bacterium]|nr:DUF3576 domain-containing protein [Nitrospinota bacterium]|tara:strand:+ start:53145 stop:53837 length:693 start_codon:yes stop_codon:yes gene_type:complete